MQTYSTHTFHKRDKSQQAVIDLSAGHHLVLAPPGCGKTDILAERIVKALDKGTKLEDMLCLTFTNRAARGMTQRIKETMSNTDTSKLFVGNIHRFCSVFLYDNKHVSMSTAILDEYDSLQVIQSIMGMQECTTISYKQKEECSLVMELQHCYHQIIHHHDPKILLFKKNSIAASSLASNIKSLSVRTGHDRTSLYEHIEEVDTTDMPDGMQHAAKFIRYAKTYAEYKEAIGAMDFDDLLLKTYDILRTLGEKAKKYSWIQIDEVQDLNPMQFAIVDLITSNSPETQVVYLGDEQQAIFSFLGAKLSTLNWLRERCKGSIHHLDKNYRSPKYLLDVFNDFAVKALYTARDLLPQPNSEEKARPGDLVLDTSSETSREEPVAALRYAVKYSSMEKRHDKDQQRVAILVPTNKDADEISNLFTNAGLPHFKISGKDVFSTPEIQTLFAHLSVINFETNIMAWAKLFKQLGFLQAKQQPFSRARQFARALRDHMLSPVDLLDYEGSSYLTELEKAYDDELIIFDTETTGLDIYEDDIVQIAAMRLRNGTITERFNIFLHTDKEIPAFLGDVENPLVKEYADPDTEKMERRRGLESFLDFIGDTPILGHNVQYDYNILDKNLKRDCLITDFKDKHPACFDSLKVARLACPRLKTYKLKNLLAAFNLEGENSHMADDDIIATKSVVDFCINKFRQVKDKQAAFLMRNEEAISSFRYSYKKVFDHTRSILYDRLPASDPPALVQELRYLYNEFKNMGIIGECDKMKHVLKFFKQDVIHREAEPSLHEQLGNHVMELNTFKEADLCDSSVIEEKFFISTVHKAKGLEFENVIVFNAMDDIYPDFRSKNNAEAQLEDARKLYVAISRAKIRLCILTCKTKRVFSEKKQQWYEFDGLPSRFLSYIWQYFQYPKEDS